MEHNFDPEIYSKVIDTFEIKPNFTTHEVGLVVVLDSLLTRDTALLIGLVARIRTPDSQTFDITIDNARDHGNVNSLFFRQRKILDVPIGSSVRLIGNQSK